MRMQRKQNMKSADKTGDTQQPAYERTSGCGRSRQKHKQGENKKHCRDYQKRTL